MSVGLNRHTQHPRPGLVAYFNFNFALVFPFATSVRIWLQKSLLMRNDLGNELRRLLSALSLGSQPLSLGSPLGPEVGVLVLRVGRGWRGGTSGFLTLAIDLGRTMHRVWILICVASARSVISSTLDQWQGWSSISRW